MILCWRQDRTVQWQDTLCHDPMLETGQDCSMTGHLIPWSYAGDRTGLFNDRTPYTMILCWRQDRTGLFNDRTPYTMILCWRQDRTGLFSDRTPYTCTMILCWRQDRTVQWQDTLYHDPMLETGQDCSMTGHLIPWSYAGDRTGLFNGRTPYTMILCWRQDRTVQWQDTLCHDPMLETGQDCSMTGHLIPWSYAGDRTGLFNDRTPYTMILCWRQDRTGLFNDRTPYTMILCWRQDRTVQWQDTLLLSVFNCLLKIFVQALNKPKFYCSFVVHFLWPQFYGMLCCGILSFDRGLWWRSTPWTSVNLYPRCTSRSQSRWLQNCVLGTEKTRDR